MLTPKQNVLRFVASLPDDVTYARIRYHVDVMQAIEEGVADAEAGRVIGHDELFDEILAKYEEGKDRVDGSGKGRSRKHSRVHRKKSPAKVNGVHPKTKASRRSTKERS